jgi:hypothetical protein
MVLGFCYAATSAAGTPKTTVPLGLTVIFHNHHSRLSGLLIDSPNENAFRYD